SSMKGWATVDYYKRRLCDSYRVFSYRYSLARPAMVSEEEKGAERGTDVMNSFFLPLPYSVT
ncbi:MAG TPA: hypothetical protein VLB01_03755, partial [Thermodesulfobacteriota bacterium]|nr:hypothetical protein [Thermodesulfobacteriota bacterium]